MLIKAAASLKQLLKRAFLLSLKVQKKIYRYILSFLKGIAFVMARTAFAGYVVVLIFWYAGLHAFYLAREISLKNFRLIP